MLIVYAVAGVLALVFLIRRFVRHRQTLEQYRDERERHAESVLASIRHENECLEPSEALQPVLAGLRELEELNPGLLACRVTQEEDRARVCVASSPPRVLELAWRVREARLSPLEGNRLLQGGGHWEVTEGQHSWSFTELADLMRFLEDVLREEAAMPPGPEESGKGESADSAGGALANQGREA